MDPSAQASVNNYFGPQYMMFGKPAVTATAQASWNAASQSKLWEESVRLTGESFHGL